MLKNPQTGVTVIEMMITVALVAILLLFALPSFNEWLTNLRVRSVAESVSAGVQAARVEAVKRNALVRFHLDSATGGGWTVMVVEGGAVVEQKGAGQGGSVAVAMLPNDDDSIEFNGMGQRVRPTPDQLTVTVSVTKPDSGSCKSASGVVRCLNILIPVGGQVHMCDPARPDGDPQSC